jgi:non-ribosomal peptide synthetase component F
MDLTDSKSAPASVEANTEDDPLGEEVFVFPTTVGQRRFWLLDQLKPGNPALNVPLAARLKGRLDRAILERAINEIVRRHEILRTSFRTLDNEVVQVIHPQGSIRLDSYDVTGYPESEREARMEQLMLEEGARSFQLSEGRLLRGGLIQIRDGEHVLMLTAHHIGCDGWSNGIIMREVAQLYSALIAGGPGLPELRLQYADFAQWQKDWLESPMAEEELQLWRTRLRGTLPILNLPTDRPRKPSRSHPGTIHTLLLPRALTDAAKRFCSLEGVTPFMLFFAIYATLLYRYTDNPEVVIGSPAANRNQTELEELIGLFSNPLIMRADLRGNPTLRELLKRVKDLSLEAFAHQGYPFERLMEEIETNPHRLGLTWLQVYFVFQKAFMVPQEMPGLTLTPLRSISPGAMFEWTLGVLERAEGVRLQLEYNTDLYDQSTIDRVLHHFQQMLETAIVDPDLRIGECKILTPSEYQQSVVDWNATRLDIPHHRRIHQLIEEQVRRSPDAQAVRGAGVQLTYQLLNCQANRLAHHLRGLGVGPESRVGMAVDGGSVEFLIGFLGILKTGGCCVVLDPSMGEVNLVRLIQESGLAALLMGSSLPSTLRKVGVPAVCFDTDADQIAGGADGDLSSIVLAEQPACVRFTSGSLGTPQGAVISHQALLSSAWATMREFGLRRDDCVSFSLDEMLPALLAGATLVLPPCSTRFRAQAWLQWVRTERITVAALATAWWHELVFTLSRDGGFLPADFRLLAVGGGRASPNVLSVWQKLTAGRIRLLDRYMLTETAGAAAFSELSAMSDSLERIAFRRAQNVRIYLLDSHLQPVPIGVPGDIFVGGESLASSYLVGSTTSAADFIADPFSGKLGDKLLKTGDRGRFLVGGGIELVGRVEDLAKTNGFRLELYEVWSVLCQHPSIWDAVVVPWETSSQRNLVAYVVSKAGAPSQGVPFRDFVAQRLPRYMVPAAFVTLDHFPTLPDGKLDRKSLPLPGSIQPALKPNFITPRTPAEKMLAEIWCEVLGLEHVGVHDNFFALGGNSLLAARLQVKIAKKLGKRVSLAIFFQAPTLAGFAEHLTEKPSSEMAVPVLLTGLVVSDKPPLFCLHFLSLAQNLAKHFELNRPVYGIESSIGPALYLWHQNRRLELSLEELATHCVTAIRRVQPRGPYYLSGFCFGGVLAFEVAGQLTLEGEKVALLALLDAAYAPGCKPLSVPWLR